MRAYQEKFDTYMGVKKQPNIAEKALFLRTQKYIKKLLWIPGIKMIAVVNSLSMYATHSDSDIDLFIITKKKSIWFVRFFVTITLWMYGVWRRNDDIAKNFCLSFFITEEAMDMRSIALENDIYLFYWVYYMKPIYEDQNFYEKFLSLNSWITIDTTQKNENIQYQISQSPIQRIIQYILLPLSSLSEPIIRYFLIKKTKKHHRNLGYPKGIIVSDMMLKFHNHDKRAAIRDTILEKNFDK